MKFNFNIICLHHDSAATLSITPNSIYPLKSKSESIPTLMSSICANRPRSHLCSQREVESRNNHRSSHHGSSVAPVAAPCPDWLDNRNLGLRSVAVCAKTPGETVELARADGPLGRRAPLKRGAKGRQLERWRAERRILGGITY